MRSKKGWGGGGGGGGLSKNMLSAQYNSPSIPLKVTTF